MQPDQQILDAIDQGSFTYAKSLIKLKQLKNPNQSYYLALNNYLLYAQGDIIDSLQECNKLLEKCPNDPRTTDLLYKIYSEQGKEKESNLIYENVIKRFPNHCEPLVNQWFMNSLKSQNLRSLQKSTNQLSKLNPLSRKYKYWCGFTNYLLANSLASDPKQLDLFLQIGYKMIQDLQPDTTQELFVFIKLLQKRDLVKTVEVIDEFIKSHNQPLDLDCKLLYLDCLRTQGDFEKLLLVTEQYLFKDMFNDFNTWKLFIMANHKRLIPFDEVESKISSYPWSRNSQLALVELSKVYNHESFVKYNIEYYNKMCSKLCCFHDLKNYHPMDLETDFEVSNELLGKCKDELLSKISSSTKELIENGDITPKSLTTLVVNQKLVHYFGKSKDTKYVSDNYKIYNKFLALTDPSVKSETDFYVANQLVLINIISSLKEDFSIQNIMKLILELKYLITKDPLDFEVNLWLIQLLSYLNINDETFQIYDKLKVRMFQNDSLGHFVINNISQLNPSKNNLQYLVNIYRFYLTYESDAPADIERGFTEQVYNKIENFLGFNNKLMGSIQYNQLILEIHKIIKISNDKGYHQFFQSKFLDAAGKIFSPAGSNNPNHVINHTFADNRDYKILWKNLGFSKKFITDFMKNFASANDSLLKLELNKELLIMKYTDNHFKSYNKLVALGNPVFPESPAKFNNWLFKIYGTLFKLNNSLNKTEFDSCNNYLMKNLKFTKVPLTKSVLSWELNYELLLLIQLILFIHGNQKLYKNYLPLANNLSNSIDDSFKTNQLDQLDEFKSLLPQDFQLDVTQESINDCVDKFRSSLIRCSYVHFKNSPYRIT